MSLWDGGVGDIFIHTMTVPKEIKWKYAIKIGVNTHCSYGVEKCPYVLKKLFNCLNNKAETRVGKRAEAQFSSGTDCLEAKPGDYPGDNQNHTVTLARCQTQFP